MALKITDDCLNCGTCEIECPYGAVYPGGTNWRTIDNKYFRFCEDIKHYDEYYSKTHYYIVPEKCTECIEIYNESRCLAVCPVACCVPDLKLRESRHELVVKSQSFSSQNKWGILK